VTKPALSLVQIEPGGQIRPRLSVPRNEAQAYQSLSESVVGQRPVVTARGGGSSPVLWVCLAFTVALGMCVWVIAICEKLAALAH
jgi:hypothetical protein